MTSQSVIVSRTYKQLDDLNDIIDRYAARQQMILDTLKYLITTLKSLEGWAVFAIFPSDDISDGKTYIACVEQRFQYCSRLLNYFGSVVSRRQLQSFRADDSSPRDSEVSSAGTVTSFARSVTSAKDGPVGLRQKILAMAKQYIDEGSAVQQAVTDDLQRCHQELLTVLQWGLSSVDELKTIFDEAMGEMLVFTVKSRMWRLLSNVGEFEEAARKVQQTMSREPENELSLTAEQPNDVNDLPERLSGTAATTSVSNFGSTSEKSLQDSGILADVDCNLATSKTSSSRVIDVSSSDKETTNQQQGMMTDDWRSLYLKNWVMGATNDTTTRLFDRNEQSLDEVDEDGLITFRSDGSTPEPPSSTRPSLLVRHPRILKTKLNRSLTSLPGLLTAVMEDGDNRSLQASWDVTSK